MYKRLFVKAVACFIKTDSHSSFIRSRVREMFCHRRQDPPDRQLKHQAGYEINPSMFPSTSDATNHDQYRSTNTNFCKEVIQASAESDRCIEWHRHKSKYDPETEDAESRHKGHRCKPVVPRRLGSIPDLSLTIVQGLLLLVVPLIHCCHA
eukprot:gb/GECG01009209.1/.p1 GENE.gb/GECG01009209.1/~~gb/GECG01009209.1/.p1  ORF type:complete len:151 (+),score=8.85 gb/GECG01009209.1/:1-453(+)